MPSSTYPQSWTLVRNGPELERAGHTVYRRGDGFHHWTAVCSKCREQAEQRVHAETMEQAREVVKCLNRFPG
jgi:hypothetical protein